MLPGAPEPLQEQLSGERRLRVGTVAHFVPLSGTGGAQRRIRGKVECTCDVYLRCEVEDGRVLATRTYVGCACAGWYGCFGAMMNGFNVVKLWGVSIYPSAQWVLFTHG